MRGQVTIFIILGIVLLAGVGILLFVINSQDVEQIGEDRALEAVPAQVQPLQRYITQCLYDTGLEAIQLSAAQGGWVQPENYRYEVDAEDPTASNALGIGEQAIIPYWYHMASPNACRNNCLFRAERPVLEGTSISVESQIEFYIQQNMDSCLDFSTFQAEVVPAGIIQTDMLFGVEDTTLTMNWPVDVIDGDVIRVDEYQVTYDIPYKRLYDAAAIIAGSTEQFNFLENHVIEIISIFSGTNRDKLPPFADLTFDLAPTVFWIRAEVEERIGQLLSAYIPGLQVASADNFVDRRADVSPAVQRIYDNMILPLEGTEFIGTNVYFDYIDFPYYFDINSGGDLIRPDSVSMSIIPDFGIQQYRNLYDVSFPVLVRVEDEQAMSGEGFTFMMAVEGNIRNNEPMDIDFNQTEAEFGFYEEPSNFCEPAHKSSWVSGNIVDATTADPIIADLQFSCGDLTCQLEPVQGRYNVSTPVCAGGVITVTKNKYQTQAIPVSTNLEQGVITETMSMDPFVEVEFMLQKRPFVKQGTQFVLQDTRWDLGPGEEAIVNMKQVDAFEPHEVVVSLTFEEDRQVVRLVPGKYTADVTIVDRRVLTIEPDRRKAKSFFGDEIYYVPETPVDLDSHVSGGALFGEANGFLKFDERIYTSERIVLDVFGFDLRTADLKIEDLDIMSNTAKYSVEYAGEIGLRYE